MDYGTDFLLRDNDQDIAQCLGITPGALLWDKSAGSSLLLFLNDSGASPAAIIAELERVAIADPRVDPATVKAARIGGGKYHLEFTPLSAIKPEVLEYDLEEGA
jgi:hypothetical protein